MSKLKVPLNGSNVVNPEREKAFKDALADEHQVSRSSNGKNIENAPTVRVEEQPISVRESTKPRLAPKQIERTALDIGQVVDHAYNHQNRTAEIHKQFIEQQSDHIDLVANVLAQQNKALEMPDPSTSSELISTFQKTLDTLHMMREQSASVHNTFLSQQSDFSDRIMSVLNGQAKVDRIAVAEPVPYQEAEPTWVVHNPPIVLDDEKADIAETTSSTADPEPAKEVIVETPSAITPDIKVEDLSQALLQIVSDKTGYPAEMLELDMDMEADLGIDSIKRVEILSSLEEDVPGLPTADTSLLAEMRTLDEIVTYMASVLSQPPAPSTETNEVLIEPPAVVDTTVQEKDISEPTGTSTNPSSSNLLEILLDIVAEKTGYPVEMLEPDMDLEADLGIDSIKRVEILSAMEEKVPSLPSIEAAILAELRTINQIAELMDTESKGDKAEISSTPGEKKKVQLDELRVQAVEVTPIPRPDQLVIDPIADQPVIIGSDGSDFTDEVTSLLKERGWKTVIWNYQNLAQTKNFHSSPSVSPADQSQDAIEEAMARLVEEHGSPAGYIHLHSQDVSELLGGDTESDRISEVFFLASALGKYLNVSPSTSRHFFLSVTRMDGRLGTGSNPQNPVSGGLAGLTKSLKWEWPGVFCRAVDLDPNLDNETAAGLLLAELYDPDQGLSEVGINNEARVTLTTRR
jgi:acyl carrier protein